MSQANPKRVLLTGYRIVRSFANPEVRSQLRQVGLTEAEYERGKALVAKAQESRKTGQRVKLSPLAAEIREWARSQLPVVHAVLTDVAPDVAEHVLEGVALSNTSDDLFFVEVVCKRLLALEASDDASEIGAWNALVEHGITHDEVASALERCVEMAHFELASDGAVAARKARDEALDALHAFHKKWSEIARSRIKDRRVLRMMGIGRFSVSSTEPEPEPVEPTPAATKPEVKA